MCTKETSPRRKTKLVTDVCVVFFFHFVFFQSGLALNRSVGLHFQILEFMLFKYQNLKLFHYHYCGISSYVLPFFEDFILILMVERCRLCFCIFYSLNFSLFAFRSKFIHSYIHICYSYFVHLFSSLDVVVVLTHFMASEQVQIIFIMVCSFTLKGLPL